MVIVNDPKSTIGQPVSTTIIDLGGGFYLTRVDTGNATMSGGRIDTGTGYMGSYSVPSTTTITSTPHTETLVSSTSTSGKASSFEEERRYSANQEIQRKQFINQAIDYEKQEAQKHSGYIVANRDWSDESGQWSNTNIRKPYSEEEWNVLVPKNSLIKQTLVSREETATGITEIYSYEIQKPISDIAINPSSSSYAGVVGSVIGGEYPKNIQFQMPKSTITGNIGAGEYGEAMAVGQAIRYENYVGGLPETPIGNIAGINLPSQKQLWWAGEGALMTAPFVATALLFPPSAPALAVVGIAGTTFGLTQYSMQNKGLGNIMGSRFGWQMAGGVVAGIGGSYLGSKFLPARTTAPHETMYLKGTSKSKGTIFEPSRVSEAGLVSIEKGSVIEKVIVPNRKLFGLINLDKTITTRAGYNAELVQFGKPARAGVLKAPSSYPSSLHGYFTERGAIITGEARLNTFGSTTTISEPRLFWKPKITTIANKPSSKVISQLPERDIGGLSYRAFGTAGKNEFGHGLTAQNMMLKGTAKQIDVMAVSKDNWMAMIGRRTNTPVNEPFDFSISQSRILKSNVDLTITGRKQTFFQNFGAKEMPSNPPSSWSLLKPSNKASGSALDQLLGTGKRINLVSKTASGSGSHARTTTPIGSLTPNEALLSLSAQKQAPFVMPMQSLQTGSVIKQRVIVYPQSQVYHGQRTILTPITSVAPKEKEENRSIIFPDIVSGIAPAKAQTPAQAVAPIQLQKQSQMQQQQRSDYGYGFSFITKFPKPKKNDDFGFNLGSALSKDWISKPMKAGYKPSLAGVLFGAKGKPTKNITGLEYLRPIASWGGGKRKKSKRRKKR